MPFTVITLTNVPNSLRGELSKWMQEIAIGVFVGNFSSRVREQLWKRVCDNVKKGEATISFSTRNEIGYTFDSYQTEQEVFELDGIPLVRYKVHRQKKEPEEKYGFSNAFQAHMQRMCENKANRKQKEQASHAPYVLIDVETTGLDEMKNRIIEIGAMKIDGNGQEEFQRLLQIDNEVPAFISELTGITTQMLNAKGADRVESVTAFAEFIKRMPLVGYNIKFDIKFLKAEFERCGLKWGANKSVDIMALVKKERMFLDSYKLSNVLSSYGIEATVQHRALEDVRLLAKLISKLNGFEAELRRKS